MFAEVYVIHRLREVDESPTLKTDVLWCLKLVVQCQEALEGMVIRGSLSNLVGELESQKKLLYLLYLPSSFIRLRILLRLSLIAVILFILPSLLPVLPLFLKGVCV